MFHRQGMDLRIVAFGREEVVFGHFHTYPHDLRQLGIEIAVLDHLFGSALAFGLGGPGRWQVTSLGLKAHDLEPRRDDERIRTGLVPGILLDQDSLLELAQAIGHPALIQGEIGRFQIAADQIAPAGAVRRIETRVILGRLDCFLHVGLGRGEVVAVPGDLAEHVGGIIAI